MIYPLIKFTDEFIDINDKNELIEKYLLNNFWYQKSNSSKREDILKHARKIPYYAEDPLKTKKAFGRINEAHDILEWLYLSLNNK